MIKATDRATMLNLMVGLNGYTLCSGSICEELNGPDYIALPFKGDQSKKGHAFPFDVESHLHSSVLNIYLNEVFIKCQSESPPISRRRRPCGRKIYL